MHHGGHLEQRVVHHRPLGGGARAPLGGGAAARRRGARRRRALLQAAPAAALAATAFGGSRVAAAAEADLLALDGLAQVQLVKDGEISVVELVSAAIERINRLNPLLNVVISADYDLAMDRAKALDAGRQKRVFEGLPFLVKDLTDVAGFQTLNGSRLCRGNVPDESAPFAQARAGNQVYSGSSKTRFSHSFGSGWSIVVDH